MNTNTRFKGYNICFTCRDFKNYHIDYAMVIADRAYKELRHKKCSVRNFKKRVTAIINNIDMSKMNDYDRVEIRYIYSLDTKTYDLTYNIIQY